MRATTEELAEATDGRAEGPPGVVDGATNDSRALRPGQLFVALVAERDGHRFVPAAEAAGAGASLVSRPVGAGPRVVVADTAEALARLGSWARGRLPDRVVGITGSVGKTTTKDLLASALGRRYVVAASVRSFNNEVGVPLTLLEAPEGTQAAVVEMGARGRGHIAHLCRVARPTIGVVTTVAEAHLEMFGTVGGVADAKAELVESLPPDGTAVLNADDPLVSAMGERTDARVLTFGDAGELRAARVVLDPELRPRFTLETPDGSVEVRLAVSGRHHVTNAVAAAAAAVAAGCRLDEIAAGLESAAASPWRMELHHLDGRALLLNDAYNANPTSMRAALEALAGLGAGRKVAVLGVMAELGDEAPAAHAEVARRAAELSVEVVAVGCDLYGVAPVGGPEEAVAALGELGPGDAVLLKGSRVAGLERVADLLLTRGATS